MALALVAAAALPPVLAEAQVAGGSTVYPVLRALDPTVSPGGEEVAVSAVGGYVEGPDGSIDSSYRVFDLAFDGQRVDVLECAGGSCSGAFVVPLDAVVGPHRITTDGGSTLTLEVTAPRLVSDGTAPVPATELRPFSAAPDRGAGPAGNPPEAAPQSKGNHVWETDVAYLAGGADSGPFRFVTAAGTGSQFRLTSWLHQYPLQGQQDSPVIPGFDVKLERLPIGGVVSAFRHTDGTLWLRTWRVEPNGEFVARDLRGYAGPKRVRGYDITARFLSAQIAEVVTTVVTEDNFVRLVTWHVGADGSIAGKFQSATVLGNRAAKDHSPTIHRQRANEYTVNFENQDGDLAWQFWTVAADGKPDLLGGTARQADLRRTTSAPASAGEAAVGLPLTPDGQAIGRLVDGNLDLSTYEHQRFTNGSVGVPSLLGASTGDLNGGPGVATPAPAVTAGRYLLSDGLFEAQGTTQGRMLSSGSINPPPSIGIASVTKAMSAHLVLSKVAEGLVKLDDCVTMSAEVFGVGNLNLSYGKNAGRGRKIVGGEAVSLEKGDSVSLRTLLEISILTSDNVATLAAAEYVARQMVAQQFPDDAAYDDFHEVVGAVYGKGFWVDRMQEAAENMGLTDTRYCDPHSRCRSTPQDQVTFWQAASLDPEFVRLTAKLNFTEADGVVEQSSQCGLRIAPFGKATAPVYPGFEGSKGGMHDSNLGVAYEDGELTCPLGEDDYEAKESEEGACEFCLVGRATRLGRTMVTAQQAVPNGGDRVPNAQALFDYGFTQVFTPDRRADEGISYGIGDFSLAALDPTTVVTTAVQKGKVHLCILTADQTDITTQWCSWYSYKGLSPGPDRPPPTRVAMVDVTSVGAEAEYVTAHADGGNLRLQRWSVGPRPA